jgi:hypothetical protein
MRLWNREPLITFWGYLVMDQTLDRAHKASFPVPQTGPAHFGEVLWPSLAALALGALLGAVAGMRYDVVFGLPEPACDILRSLVVTATWTCLSQGDPGEMRTTSPQLTSGDECQDPRDA